MVFPILIVVIIVIVLVISTFRTEGEPQAALQKSSIPKITLPEIQRCNSVKGVAMSVNHGRAYPFFVGMSCEQAMAMVKKIIPDTTELENKMQLFGLMGVAPYIDFPTPQSRIVESISMQIRSGVVAAITIYIRDFDINFKALADEMVVKFGRPTSVDSLFIIWREGNMVIHIHREGSIMVFDERL